MLLVLLAAVSAAVSSECTVDTACPEDVQFLQNSFLLQPTLPKIIPNKVALEEHIWFPEWSDAAGDHASAGEELQDFGKRRLDSMDEAGIQIAVLSPNGPFLQDFMLYNATSLVKGLDLTAMNASQILELQVHVAKQSNDLLYKHMNNSSRYRGFASLPMLSPSAAAEELMRCVNDYGFVGALINGIDTSTTHITGEFNWYDSTVYDVLWQKFDELEVPLYIHPRDVPAESQFYKKNPRLTGKVWGFAEGTAQFFMNLKESGVFERFQNMKVVLGHFGETLPFQAWRIDKQSKGTSMQDTLRKNVYVTTSGFFDTLALQHAIAVMGLERILFSVDYPFESTQEAGSWFEQAVKSLALNETDKEKIEFSNADKLLRNTSRVRPTV